ncbi:MAG TPA: hypothetical protein PKI62_14500 [bacterium]|nr:hypothetical protein [bacterium]HPR88961.1 hypothetical protein [bacterium]
MKLLLFENSPRMILKMQKYLTSQDTWYATMDTTQTRDLVVKEAVDVIVVRKCHEELLWQALGNRWTEGMPGGRQVVVLPRMGSGIYLRRYMRSQQSPA